MKRLLMLGLAGSLLAACDDGDGRTQLERNLGVPAGAGGALSVNQLAQLKNIRETSSFSNAEQRRRERQFLQTGGGGIFGRISTR
ncbi:MAG: hypothetical protein AAGE76_10135 [Pseudomonadota bacterium]